MDNGFVGRKATPGANWRGWAGLALGLLVALAAWRRCAASGTHESGDPVDDDNGETSDAGGIWSTHMPWTCPQIDLTGSFQMVSSSACACAAKFSPFSSSHSSAHQEAHAVVLQDD